MKIYLLLLALAASLSMFAQAPTPTNIPFATVERIVLPTLDNKTLQQAELDRRLREPDVAPQFAKAIALPITPFTNGTWETLPNGNLLWRLRIYSKDAHSLNLGFSQYQMPEGASLLLYSPDQQQILGPFTPSDNEDHEQLWTPMLKGDEVILEVQIPASRKAELKLQLKTVNHDFMNFLEIQASACHLDVVCGAANGWGILDQYRDAIQSVAAYGLDGTAFCTGFLVNNTQNDCTPYFITANHCGINANNAPSMVVFWKYQNSTCRDLRPPVGGNLGDGNQNTYNTGAIFRAAYPITDFLLVELDDPVADTASAFFAGWNVSNTLPTDTVALIHHPGGEEKRVSFEFNGVYTGAWGNNDSPVTDGNYLIVADYDIGSSEGGSSGAPLFNKNQQAIGHLRGGAASCGNDDYDSFGWLAKSWEGGGTKQTRLRDWLDPSNSGITAINGKEQTACSFVLNINTPIQEVCAPNAATYTIQVSNTFVGAVQLTVAGLPAGASAVFSQNPVNPGSSVTLTINNTAAITAGKYTLTLTAADATQSTQNVLSLVVSSGTVPTVTLQTPANGAERVSLSPEFLWTASTTATYQFQIAKDAAFTMIVTDIDSLNSVELPNIRLEATTTYFWRVRASTICGQGNWSTPAQFTTADIVCTTVASDSIPQEISDLITSTVTDSVRINLPGTIAEVRVNGLDITHEWIGDLQVSLTSPEGTSIRLFDRPGVPNDQFGCDGRDVKASFSDTAPKTAQQLETTCNSEPAIDGAYRPLDPFALLAGEPAQGQWKLIVQDFEPEDGGALNAWSLEVCASRPKDIFITTDSSNFYLCAGQPLTFRVAIGKEFDKNTGGVRFITQGSPQGSTVNFSKNPAAAGDTIQVTVSNFNTTQDSTYTLILVATDGRDTARTELKIQVSSSTIQYDLTYPGDNSQNIPLSTALEWEAVSNVSYYIVTLIKSPNVLVISDTVRTNSYPINNLSLGTNYQWSVKAVNPCGTGVSGTFQFKTIPDLSFGATPALVNACPPYLPSYTLFIGPGFNRPAAVSYTVSPQATLPITFSGNANDVPVGTTIKANFGSLSNTPPGEYTLTFKVSDGTYTMVDEVKFVLRGVPAVPVPALPLDGAAFPEQAPTLSWKRAKDAVRYRIEIATNDNFANIVRTATVTDTFYKVEPRLGGGVFYWRLTSLNDCGFSTSRASDFMIQAAGVHEWQGQEVIIAPNPTSGLLNIRFAQALKDDLDIEVFSLNGQLLQRNRFGNTNTALSIDLSTYPSGVYLVRLINGEAALTERILLHK